MKLLTIAACLVGLASLSFADAKAEIDAGNKLVTDAMKTKDLAKIEKALKTMTTPDFVHIENGQKQNLTQTIAGIKMGVGGFKKVTIAESKVISLKVSGDKATGRVHRSMGGTMAAPDKKEHTMEFSGDTDDVYVKVKGKWKLAVMSWVSQKALMDGKPMDGPMGGPPQVKKS